MRPKWRVTPNVSIKDAPTNVQLQGRNTVVNLREVKITCIIWINVTYVTATTYISNFPLLEFH